MYIIRNFLSKEEVKDVLENLNSWTEGYTKSSKTHKDNSEQVQVEYAQKIAQKIQHHPIARNKLFIKNMTLPRFNKYEVGQKYEKHIDSFKQQGVQTDWSYTVMLEAPTKGGELSISESGTTTTVSLTSGDIVIYNSGNVHQVLPVEEGTRTAAIGWIESLITRPDEREILSNLVDVMQDLDIKPEHKEQVLKLSYSYHNLLRLWSK